MNWPFPLWFSRDLRVFAAINKGHAISEYAIAHASRHTRSRARIALINPLRQAMPPRVGGRLHPPPPIQTPPSQIPLFQSRSRNPA